MMDVSLAFVIGLLVPVALVVTALLAAWRTSVEADRRLRDEETAHARSLGPKPGA
jgi:hypothetical protein